MKQSRKISKKLNLKFNSFQKNFRRFFFSDNFFVLPINFLLNSFRTYFHDRSVKVWQLVHIREPVVRNVPNSEFFVMLKKSKDPGTNFPSPIGLKKFRVIYLSIKKKIPVGIFVHVSKNTINLLKYISQGSIDAIPEHLETLYHN